MQAQRLGVGAGRQRERQAGRQAACLESLSFEGLVT